MVFELIPCLPCESVTDIHFEYPICRLLVTDSKIVSLSVFPPRYIALQQPDIRCTALYFIEIYSRGFNVLDLAAQ